MRPVVRSVLPLLLAATVVAPAFGARAGAQPGCPTAPVFDYFRPQGGGIGPCRVGDWVFTGFFREGGTEVTGLPGDIDPTPAGNFLITPFIGSILLPISNSALRTVGFEFTGFTPHVSFSGTTVPHDQGAAVWNGLTFRGASLLPEVGLVGALVDAWMGVDLQSDPSLAAWRTSVGGSVGGESAWGSCFSESETYFGPPGPPRSRIRLTSGLRLCPSPLPRTFVASVGASAFLGPRSSIGGVFLSGTSSGTVERITFITNQVVPEPTTVALLGGGLALLGLGAWRRGRA